MVQALVLRFIVRLTVSAAALITMLGWQSGALADSLRLDTYGNSPIVVHPLTLFHTLAADFYIQPDGTIYVQTGDIPAMWLRDSAAQTLPYVRFSAVRPAFKTWIRAVVEREARNIIVDPYANAFTSHYRVWEEKWEVDSLSYPLLLAWAYFARTRDHRIFTPRFHEAMKLIVSTYAREQLHATHSHYRFPGTAVADVPRTGMIWSAFRASDDPVEYGFNIPQQMLAATALENLGTLAIFGFGDVQLSAKAAALGVAIRQGIARYGVVYNFRYGWIYAYEVDGRGHSLMMDDANVPSLLSAPFFGFVGAGDAIYQATRRFILSKDDPYYGEGRIASGVGSPHTPTNWVWPLGIIAQGLTALSVGEARAALLTLSQTDSNDGLIHESFDPNDGERFTRAEFGWGNAMYAELIFRSAAGFSAQSLWPRGISLLALGAPTTPQVVGPVERLINEGDIISAFERVMPLQRRRCPC